MREHTEQTHDGLQERNQDASPVLPTSSRAQAGDSSESKPVLQSRGEKIPQGSRLSAKHSVFVLAWDGTPLTPTTPAKAKKLLKHGGVKKVWSKFGAFGIQILYEVRSETPRTALGVDHGTKFEGYSVVVDKENNLNVKIDLPDKKQIVRKMEERKALRQSRRNRGCRRRVCRGNRSRRGFMAPSQKAIVGSRLKMLTELCRIYPVTVAGVEDVCFNHARYRWGANFSTVEIGKNTIRGFFREKGIEITEYKGYETSEIRKEYGYVKTPNKSEDCFESHCSDSLSLACILNSDRRIEPGPLVIVDDTYRCVRRRLHDSQFSEGGVRPKYSTGVINGIRKGILIGVRRGLGLLCGTKNGSFRYYDQDGKRQESRVVLWISSSFRVKRVLS